MFSGQGSGHHDHLAVLSAGQTATIVQQFFNVKFRHVVSWRLMTYPGESPAKPLSSYFLQEGTVVSMADGQSKGIGHIVGLGRGPQTQ